MYVKMDKFVFLVEIPQQDELSFATTTDGAQCVMTGGALEMLKSSADSLDCLHHVSDE